jgi:hypothetical protein
MQIEELHEVICDALREMSGVDGNTLVEEGQNADIIHHGHRVVTEVKTVFHDRARSDAHQKRAKKIISKYLKSVGRDHINFDIRIEDLPPNIQKKLAKDLSIPFEKDMKTANKQIRNTKKYLDEDYIGLLILGLPNDFVANEGDAFAFMSRWPWPNRFREIECVLMLAVDTNPTPQLPNRVFISERNVGAIPRAFTREFDENWIGFLEKRRGGPMNRIMTEPGAFLRDFGLRKD